MLNSFASDLDSILSDLSTSPPLDIPAAASAEGIPDDSLLSASGAGGGRGGGRGHTSSCPDLSFQRTTAAEVAAPLPTTLPSTLPATLPPPNPDLSLLERLIRSHPIWYLPQLQRSAAVTLLQNQQQGVMHCIITS